ncbi:hypothetical protein F5Y17DRAFT_474228 [Xylariaceae sp. FL0594]|nr:hypothetical protein F5Y17DRAFT_474228 [Xylariaceae sp. FL0594]
MPPDMPSVDDGGPLIELFATSRYLARAGLDWKEFYARVLRYDEWPKLPYYSQHAAIFLLTLLPNVHYLELPHKWEPVEETDKLLEAIVSEARQPGAVERERSLARVTHFKPYDRINWQAPTGNLETSVPFLALPNVRFFMAQGCRALGTERMLLEPPDPYSHYGENLEAVNFYYCRIDSVAMAELLNHTQRLRVLAYVHASEENPGGQEWDVCSLIEAIGSGVGSHLEQLSLYAYHSHCPLTPGRASMRRFTALKKFQCPLQLAMRKRDDTATEDVTEQVLYGLVPATVSELAWVVGGQLEDAVTTLRRVLDGLAAVKESRFPDLKVMQISYNWDRHRPFPWSQDDLTRISEEVERIGLRLIQDTTHGHEGGIQFDIPE